MGSSQRTLQHMGPLLPQYCCVFLLLPLLHHAVAKHAKLVAEDNFRQEFEAGYKEYDIGSLIFDFENKQLILRRKDGTDHKARIQPMYDVLSSLREVSLEQNPRTTVFTQAEEKSWHG